MRDSGVRVRVQGLSTGYMDGSLLTSAEKCRF